MKTKLCLSCKKAESTEVIRIEEPSLKMVRVGWYCPDCKAFEPAILRERIVDDSREGR